MIYANPGQPFEATMSGAPSGLTGTMGARILDNDGGTTVPRATAGIAEFPAGSGFYTTTLIAPTVAGQYTVMWDTGTVTPSTTAVEDLVVTTTSPILTAPSGIDLCTLADVRGRRQTGITQTGQDEEVSRLITAISAAIAEDLEREFHPTNGAARTFEYDPQEGDTLSLAPYDVRTVTALRLNPDATTPTVLAAGDYRLQPYPSKHGTFTAIRMRPSVVIPNASWCSVLVEITGDWGFTEIPANVREAAIISVVHNMRTTVGQYSHADGQGGETRYERVEIPQAAKDLLAPFQRMG